MADKETQQDNSGQITLRADPVDFVHGLLSSPRKATLTLASESLKGIRGDDLKNRINLAISGIAREGALKSNLSDESKYEIYDDLEAIYKAIESGESIKILKGKISLYLWSLTEDGRERVFTRKLMSIYSKLSEDAITVLKFADDADLEVYRQVNQGSYITELAKKSGLNYPNFAQIAVEELVRAEIMSGTYMDMRASVLTDVGRSLVERIRKYDIFSL